MYQEPVASKCGAKKEKDILLMTIPVGIIKAQITNREKERSQRINKNVFL